MHSSLEKALRDFLLTRLLTEQFADIPRLGAFSLHHIPPKKEFKGHSESTRGSEKLDVWITPPVHEIRFHLTEGKKRRDGESGKPVDGSEPRKKKRGG